MVATIDLGIAAALLVASLAATIVATVSVQAATSEKGIPIVFTVESFKHLTTGTQAVFRFRDQPRASVIPRETVTEGATHTFNFKIERPSFRSRYAFEVVRYKKGEEPGANETFSIITARALAREATWRRIAVREGADFSWQVPAHAKANSELSNVVDVVALSSREWEERQEGQARNGIFLKDFSVMRFVIEPSAGQDTTPGSNDQSTPPVTASPLSFSLAPTSPGNSIVQQSRPDNTLMQLDVAVGSAEDVRLEELQLTIDITNRDDEAATQALLTKLLPKLALQYGSRTIAQTTLKTTGTATRGVANFAFTNLELTKGTTHTFLVKGDIGGFTEAGTQLSGTEFTISLLPKKSDGTLSVLAKGADTNATLTSPSITHAPATGVQSNTITVAGGNLETSWKGDTPSGIKTPSEKQLVGKFQLKFNSYGDKQVRIADIDLKVTTSIAPQNIERTLRIYRDSVTQTNELKRITWQEGEDINTVLASNLTVPFAKQVLPPGVIKDYYITLDTIGAQPGNTVNVAIERITWSDFDTVYFTTVDNMPLETKTISF